MSCRISFSLSMNYCSKLSIALAYVLQLGWWGRCWYEVYVFMMLAAVRSNLQTAEISCCSYIEFCWDQFLLSKCRNLFIFTILLMSMLPNLQWFFVDAPKGCLPWRILEEYKAKLTNALAAVIELARSWR